MPFEEGYLAHTVLKQLVQAFGKTIFKSRNGVIEVLFAAEGAIITEQRQYRTATFITQYDIGINFCLRGLAVLLTLVNDGWAQAHFLNETRSKFFIRLQSALGVVHLKFLLYLLLRFLQALKTAIEVSAQEARYGEWLI